MIRNVSNCFHKFRYKVTVLKQIFPTLDCFNWKTPWDPKASYIKIRMQNACDDFQVITYENKFLKCCVFKAERTISLNREADKVNTAIIQLSTPGFRSLFSHNCLTVFMDSAANIINFKKKCILVKCHFICFIGQSFTQDFIWWKDFLSPQKSENFCQCCTNTHPSTNQRHLTPMSSLNIQIPGPSSHNSPPTVENLIMGKRYKGNANLIKTSPSS